jgi:hypothetical protein
VALLIEIDEIVALSALKFATDELVIFILPNVAFVAYKFPILDVLITFKFDTIPYILAILFSTTLFVEYKVLILLVFASNVPIVPDVILLDIKYKDFVYKLFAL